MWVTGNRQVTQPRGQEARLKTTNLTTLHLLPTKIGTSYLSPTAGTEFGKREPFIDLIGVLVLKCEGCETLIGREQGATYEGVFAGKYPNLLPDHDLFETDGAILLLLSNIGF